MRLAREKREFFMHYTGTIWRPPYEASSMILEVTAGCTHHQCKFCTLYDDLPFKFRMTPIDDIEADLKEAKGKFCIWIGHKISRTFLTGANPFVMSYENLAERALLIHDYLVECQTIAMFSSIRDIKNKKVWQLRRLRSLGINGISIGTESGDNSTLLLANKGYTAKDLIEQCRKLDEAGIEYYFVYMTGLAGKGNGYRNAVNSAKVFSKVNPRFISVDSLKLFPDTELYRMAQERNFIPAGEKERLEELQTFIKHLQIRTHLFANSVSNFYPTTAFLPKERDRIISELQYIIDTVSEEEMQEYRRNLHTLG